MSTVTSLHGTTPAEIFQSGLENIEDIEAVAVSVRWRGGDITTGWSNADPGTLALMAIMLDERFRMQFLRNAE
jgi:hypothetical protein